MSENISNMPTVSLSRVSDMIEISAASRQPLIIWGPPGVGKSALVRAFAKEKGADLVDIRLSQYDAVDLRGLPDTGSAHDPKGDSSLMTVWLKPSTMPFVGNPHFSEDRPIVLFLDEIMQAAPALQSIAFQLLHPDDRAVGEHQLMDNVIVVGASNRETDRAGVQKMLTPVANRCMHVNVESSLDAWKDWALANEIDHTIVAYLNFRPEHMSQFEQALKSNAKAFPTERAWEGVSRVMHLAGHDTQLRDLMIAAIIGEGVASEFASFCRMAERAPSFKEIVAAPTKTKVPSERDMLCAISGMLTRKTDSDTIENVIPYVKRMPEEYQVVWVADVTRSKPKLVIQSKAMLDYQIELKEIIYD